MSIPARQATFQHALGMSPMAHLRRTRLNRVHADLLRASGSDTRISDIALRWASFTRAASPASTGSGSAS